MTLTQFISCNPAVSQDCGTGFWASKSSSSVIEHIRISNRHPPDYAYCIGTTDTIPTTHPVPSPSPTATSIPIPTPNQPNNAISACNKFAQAQDGDWCAKFAKRNNVSLQDLYAWNTVFGADGSGCGSSFWKDYWYCVGIKH